MIMIQNKIRLVWLWPCQQLTPRGPNRLNPPDPPGADQLTDLCPCPALTAASLTGPAASRLAGYFPPATGRHSAEAWLLRGWRRVALHRWRAEQRKTGAGGRQPYILGPWGHSGPDSWHRRGAIGRAARGLWHTNELRL